MPAKRKATEATDGAIASKPKPKVAKGKAYKMPTPLPQGEILTSLDKSQWKIGRSIGKGGFGEIYCAVSLCSGRSGQFVMKVEPHENGPLFSELAFYQRVAKEDKIESWKKKHSLKHLGVPRYVASGTHVNGSNRYRFLVMDQFGDDLEKKFTEHGRKFGMKVVCSLAIQLLQALEFIHSEEYVHADIKGSNLLLGYRHPEQVFLVDYGLAYRYCPEGVHKPPSEDARRAHNGTIEFTSRDAHRGAHPSRRGDLEILGFCMVQWASGTLPWMGRLDNCAYVAQMKDRYMKDLPGLFDYCFGKEPAPHCLVKYFEYCSKLRYDETPDYERLRQLFLVDLKKSGGKGGGTMLDWSSPSKQKSPKKEKMEESCAAVQRIGFPLPNAWDSLMKQPLRMEVKDLPDPVEEDVQSARDMDAHILQRKRHKEDGSSSKGKRSKASAVQKVEEVHVSARRKQRAVVLDSSDPEQADLQLLPPKRVRKQVRSPSSPTKYKFRKRKDINYVEADDTPPKRSKK